MKILIIGAGIIGMATAYRLIQDGHQVQVLECEPQAGLACSYMNGGQFSYSYAEPLASPSILSHLPAMLLNRHAGLSIRRAALPQIIPWGVRFLRNCTSRRFAANVASVLKLALLSRRELNTFVQSDLLEFTLRNTGKLHVYSDTQNLACARELVRLKNHYDVGQEVWDELQCVQHEPALKHFQGPIAGGVFSPLDQSGNTFQLIQALITECRASGAQVHTKVAVTAIETRGGSIHKLITTQGDFSADAYVLCAGANSSDLMLGLGVRLPIIPAKGYSVTVPALPSAPEINLTDMRYKIVYTRLGKQLRIAGTMVFAGDNRTLEQQHTDRLLGLARATLPLGGQYDQVIHRWTGLRPMTPDSIPVIGPTRWSNFWLNTGHGMLGSTLAFGSASLLSDLLVRRKPDIDGQRFSPARFGLG